MQTAISGSFARADPISWKDPFSPEYLPTNVTALSRDLLGCFFPSGEHPSIPLLDFVAAVRAEGEFTDVNHLLAIKNDQLASLVSVDTDP